MENKHILYICHLIIFQKALTGKLNKIHIQNLHVSNWKALVMVSKQTFN